MAKKGTLTLTATVTGAEGGVTWSVEGGSANGSVDAGGTYTAPAVVPDAQVIVRATSVADSRGTATATVRVVVGGEALTVNPNRALSPSGSTANTFSGGQRSVAIAGSTVYMVWNDNHTGDDDVYLSVSQDRGVTIGAPIRVNDDATTAPQLAPSVAVDGSGRAVIAWLDARWNLDPTYDVYVATATVDTTGAVTVGKNQRVTAVGTNEDRDPSVALALDRSGNAYLAWGDGTSGDTDVLLTKGSRLPSGQFNFAPPVKVHENYFSDQSRPALAVDTAGNVVVAWNDRQPLVDQDVYWRRGQFDATGAIKWPAAEVRVNLQTDGDQVSPSVAVDQDGVAYVAWGQQVGLERRKLYFAKSGLPDQNGYLDMTVTANTEVLPAVDADQNFPSLVVRGDEVTIAFADNRGCPACGFDPFNPKGTGPTDVYLVRSVDGGATFGPSLPVNDDQSALALHGRASVAVDDVGRAYVVWTDARNGSSQAQAFMARVE
ncbi:MAG: hypothetical protein HY207_12960 [Nitrospirae bacterium]|nr:hypothetical protein [Nitrospirota bacterium]